MSIYDTMQEWNGKKLDGNDRVLLWAIHSIMALEDRLMARIKMIADEEAANFAALK